MKKMTTEKILGGCEMATREETEDKIEISENGKKVTVRRGDYGVSATVGFSELRAFYKYDISHTPGYFVAIYTLIGKSPAYVIGDSKKVVDRFERDHKDLLYTCIRELNKLTPGGLPPFKMGGY